MNSPMPSSIVQIPRASIQQLVVKLLQRKGMFIAEAEIVAERMMEADLERRAADGARSLPHYLEAMDLGDIDPRAQIITVSETAGVAVLDGGSGMGHVAATRAMQTAIEKGRAVGTGTVVVKNSRPAGDLGVIARLAAKAGMIGFITTSFSEPRQVAEVQDLAWSMPAPEGLQPLVGRESRQNLGMAAIALCGILPAGLVGADVWNRKRKGLAAANVVEYCLLAFDPAVFGAGETMLEKCRALWSADEFQMLKPVAPSTEELIPYSTSDAELLASLAARIKLPLKW